MRVAEVEKLVAHCRLSNFTHEVIYAFYPELEFLFVVPLNSGFVHFCLLI